MGFLPNSRSFAVDLKIFDPTSSKSRSVIIPTQKQNGLLWMGNMNLKKLQGSISIAYFDNSRVWL